MNLYSSWLYGSLFAASSLLSTPLWFVPSKLTEQSFSHAHSAWILCLTVSVLLPSSWPLYQDSVKVEEHVLENSGLNKAVLKLTILKLHAWTSQDAWPIETLKSHRLQLWSQQEPSLQLLLSSDGSWCSAVACARAPWDAQWWRWWAARWKAHAAKPTPTPLLPLTKQNQFLPLTCEIEKAMSYWIAL